MKVLIDIGHPAHIHFFKKIIINLKSHGHEIIITTRDTDIIKYLLNTYGFDFFILGKHGVGIFQKATGLLIKDYNLYKIAKKFKPDLLIGIGNEYISQISFLINRPSIVFTDTEDATLTHFLTVPFAHVMITPKVFKKDFGKKHVRINGFKEAAYLHPNHFFPCPREELNISPNEKIIIVRFISWGAAHDLSLKGINHEEKLEFIRTLSKYGKVMITSEKQLEGDLEKYRIHIPAEKMHSLLFYSDLYIGEGGTMAAEAGVLGTPAIHIESTSDGRATGENSGNFLELRDTYDLLYFYPTPQLALKKAIEILKNPNSKHEWQEKQQKLWANVDDVTTWFTKFIEEYPESFFEYKKENRKN
jgi:predicted glycosyltransferase